MREFKKRRTLVAETLRILLGVAGIFALAGIAFVASNAAWGMYGKFAEAASARALSEAQLQTLEDRHQKINVDVQALSSERGLEAEVRERYGLSRPGEGQINIVRQSTSTDALKHGPGLLQKFWQMLTVW